MSVQVKEQEIDPSFNNNLLNTIYFDLSDFFFGSILKTKAWKS